MRTVLAIVACLASGAHAADYWVSTAGSDAATGLAPATAWATLPHAAAQVGPGDTVHVLDGAYQGFHLETSGAPGAPITFHAEGDDVRITADNPVTPDGINLEGASWVVIDGFVVDGRTRAGVRAVTAAHVTVRNCRLGYNGRWGILTGFVDDFLAEGNEAHHSQIEHGIYVSNSCDRPVVRRNVVHHNAANGLHFNGDASLGGDGLVEDALVERNVVYENGASGGSAINMDGSVRGVVRNNLLYANHASGISLYRIDAAAGSSANLVVNNTVVQAADGRWAINVTGGSTGNTLRNNILWTAHPFRGVISVDASSLPGFASDWNVVLPRFSADGGDTVLTLAAWQAQGHDAHALVADPAALFLAPGTDWHLAPASPALDAGTATGAPADDLDGAPRPVGAGVDVGAYERQLLFCGDGDVDAGEACGEPGLACADACTTCLGCSCVAVAPACGDGLVCGAEDCELDADCGPGRTCTGCACTTPPPCASGIVLDGARLAMRAAPFSVTLRGEAVIPQPWTAVDPATHGLRVVVDAPTGAGGIDVTLPAGAPWRHDAGAGRWTRVDPSGAVGGVRKVVVQDRSRRTPGLVRVVVKAKGTGGVLPPADATRASVLFGSPGECASASWNPPAGPRPRCEGGASRLACR